MVRKFLIEFLYCSGMGRTLMCHGWTTRTLNISITNCFPFETQTKDIRLFPKSAECISLFVFSPAFSSSLSFFYLKISNHTSIRWWQHRKGIKTNGIALKEINISRWLGGTGAQASCRSFVDGVIYSVEQCLQLIGFQCDSVLARLPSRTSFYHFFNLVHNETFLFSFNPDWKELI